MLAGSASSFPIGTALTLRDFLPGCTAGLSALLLRVERRLYMAKMDDEGKGGRRAMKENWAIKHF